MRLYYHYTSIDALFSIVENREIWMNCLGSMNDENEGLNYIKFMENYLGLEISEASEDKVAKWLASSCKNFLRWNFCFSASSSKDDVSQWRAYTPIGRGVCIVFSDGFLNNKHLVKYDCIYDPKLKKQFVVKHPRLNMKRIDLENIMREKDKWDKYLLDTGIGLARFKNETFRAEAEKRWVVGPSGFDEFRKSVNYRPHSSGLVSYIKVPVNFDRMHSIILGPQVPSMNDEVIFYYLDDRDAYVPVYRSKSTLRLYE